MADVKFRRNDTVTMAMVSDALMRYEQTNGVPPTGGVEMTQGQWDAVKGEMTKGVRATEKDRMLFDGFPVIIKP